MTGRRESAGNAFTTPRAPTVASAKAAISGTLPGATVESAHVTSWVLNAASVWSVRTVCASVPQGSASVYQMSWVSHVTTAPRTTGTWPAGGAVMPVAVIPTTRSPPRATSSQDSVSVVTALEGRPAQTVKRTTGEILGLSAELVTVTGVALRRLSATG